MSTLEGTRTFGARLLRLTWANAAIGLALALVLWLAQAKGNRLSLPTEVVASLVHSLIYGLAFGLTMPYLAERFVILRAASKWAAIVASLILIAAASTLLVGLCLLGLGLQSVGSFWLEFLYKSSTVFVIALAIGLGIYAYERLRDHLQATNLQLRTQELEKERALKLATEAKLASLESRLHPHFLFNTLNSISALIAEDPPLADQMVQRLAALLRTSLDACEHSSVPLSEEIKLVADYLEIERARFRERLSYSIEVEPGAESAQVPPLTLQPVVENSVKFAVAPRPSGGHIKISARLRNGSLVVEVQDDGAGFDADMFPRGHGLDNLHARLFALFGDNAKMLINSNDAGTTVALHMPSRAAQVI
ncbi:MAG: two-component system, LytTR family, sensor histidine kinase AlgZ [Acidobacteriota bacterium]|jgi:sensor histidine kinase YesM|nr:two-component system, LytTR family, sensor histidine kinase AlgZ [Acidobacteriota bacterium]